MTVRKEVLKEIEQSESVVLGESVLKDRLAADEDSVDAALRGLRQEGALEEHRLMDSAYYSLSANTDVEQAATRTSESELAQEIIQTSDIFGTPLDESNQRKAETQEIVDRIFK